MRWPPTDQLHHWRLQAWAIARLARFERKRQEATEPTDRRLAGRAVYAAFLDCRDLGIEKSAKRTLAQMRMSEVA